MASDRRPYHKSCVKCNTCVKKLSPATINEHAGKLFCNLCYTNNFMPQEDLIPERVVMQVLPVGGIYTAMEEEKRRALEESMRKEMEARARREGGCPGCGSKATGEDCVELSSLRFHKKCLRCTLCARAAEESVQMMLGPRDTDNVFGTEELDPFCKYCFSKKFNIGTMDIADTVNIVKGL